METPTPLHLINRGGRKTRKIVGKRNRKRRTKKREMEREQRKRMNLS